MDIAKYKLVFWDFDGVIKDSLDAKADAFVGLFDKAGSGVKEFIRTHHFSNGGLSRYEKIPIYMAQAGQEVLPDSVNALCKRFGEMVVDAVITSKWVPGVERLLRSNPYDQEFFLVSATPQEELNTIVESLRLSDCFSAVYGSPTSKVGAIIAILGERGIEPEITLFIGDSIADLNAATQCNVSFLLRSHARNESSFQNFQGASVEDFQFL